MQFYILAIINEYLIVQLFLHDLVIKLSILENNDQIYLECFWEKKKLA